MSGKADDPRDMVDKAAAVGRGDDPERNTEERANQNRDDGELECSREDCQKIGDDGASGRQRRPRFPVRTFLTYDRNCCQIGRSRPSC